ncbi:MAG: phosphatidate cytidylyltransferase [Roseovarius sp.]|nr:phosphatidate cytidylyltransferase [Roseovarius sp.]
MSGAARWDDLVPRVVSGVVLAAAGGLILWLGGWVFALAVCAVGGVMAWEAARLFAAPAPVQDGLLAGLALVLGVLVTGVWALLPVLVAALVTATRAGRDRRLCFGFQAWVLLAVLALVTLRNEAGLVWALWLVAVVVVTDVAGYFAGRSFGGPKFWPRVSPKKTWAGTVAGWAAAAAMGVLFAPLTGAGVVLAPVSVPVAFAGQMGDIAESAVKRRAGVKDSSTLIPGHGGLLDRFDALMGAAAAAALMWALGAIPQGA